MSVEAVFSSLQRLLLDAAPSYAAFQQEAKRYHEALDPLEQARIALAIRLADALRDLADRRAGYSDIAVLLRGACRMSGKQLRVPSQLWRLITQHNTDTGLLELGMTATGEVVIDAATWQPDWLPGAERIDTIERRSFDQPSIGDGLLFAMTGWPSYQSEAQKAAVHAFLFAAPGTTTLITMPTGSGKSLCAQLPAWANSRGGTIRGGTTLVIVPTVALAIDQRQRALAYFKRTPNEEYRPQSWIGGMSDSAKATIKRGLINGTLPMLFLSPEALIGSELYTICLEAARKGSLRRLVLDEAHLVETWGAGFRTDFQFLSTYRRQLLAASGGMLRTLLLTATLTADAEELLSELFAEPERLSTIHAGRLRPEISYWMHMSRSWVERRSHVLEALCYLPRPLILYATAPEHAERWLQDLKSAGYQRAAAFTGDTKTQERERLIKLWGDGAIDIMCATSAFGLGIDKRDVRAIIHACIPENVDRFYQEVGRSGRDGCSAISLVCAVFDDFGAAERMVKEARISSERSIPRWLGMVQGGRLVEGRGDTMDVNIDALPEGRIDLRPSEKNRDWNEHTLLLAQRADLLTIEDARAEVQTDVEAQSGALPPLWMRVRLARPDSVSDTAYIAGALEEARSSELSQLYDAFDDIRTLIQDMTGQQSPQRCIGLTLVQKYPYTELACGGCPACRTQHDEPYANPIELRADIVYDTATSRLLNDDLAVLIGEKRQLTLQYYPPETLAGFTNALTALVGLGIQQIILADELLGAAESWPPFMKKLAAHARTPHRIVTANEVCAHREQVLFPISTAIIYPSDAAAADRLHMVLKRVLAAAVPRIHIVSHGLYLHSERGRFTDRVEGLVRELHVIDRLSDEANDDLF